MTSISVGLSIKLLSQMSRYGTIRGNILDSVTRIWILAKPTSMRIAYRLLLIYDLEVLSIKIFIFSRMKIQIA